VNAGVLAGTAAILDVLGGVAEPAGQDAAPEPLQGGSGIGGFGILIPDRFSFSCSSACAASSGRC